MVTIGVQTYNRKEILKMMADSFYNADIKSEYNLRIYDDCSDEYDEKELRKIFPNAVSIVRHENNLGADGNMKYMYEDFINSGDDIFFNADSDLIFRKNFLDIALKFFKNTDGILSLFNAKRHKVIASDGVLVEKEILGAAGTLFSRSRLKEFVDAYRKEKVSRGYDCTWSEYFRHREYRLFAFKESLVQHIGINGYNSSIEDVDFGDGFYVDSKLNGQILNEVLFMTIKSEKKAFRNWYAVFPFFKVGKNSRVLLYGGGQVGNDYAKQMKTTEYCKYVGTVDSNYSSLSKCFAPEEIRNIDFDFLVLAAARKTIREEMLAKVISIAPECVNKIINEECNIIKLN